LHGWPWDELNKPLIEKVKANESPSLVADTKASRGNKACLILSRLPGLRVLSVDLGHRYAAACAVWETLTIQQMNDACKVAHHAPPSEADLYLHLATTGADGKKRTAVYRRIGADQIEDIDQATGEVRQVPHPAPWARLERQFLIKLPGEEKPTREASNDEIWLAHELERQMGLAVPLIDRLVQAGWGRKEKQPQRVEALKKLGWRALPKSADTLKGKIPANGRKPPLLRVDELMSATVQNVRLALRRHGDTARRIAYPSAARKLRKRPCGQNRSWRNRRRCPENALLSVRRD
jgi:hypothetical protein